MAVVEDYIPDSDDEDLPQSLPQAQPIQTTLAEEPVPEKNCIKGSSISDLVDRLRVPDAFKDAVKVSEISTAQVDAHRRRITAALAELADRLPRRSANGEPSGTDGASPGDAFEAKAYAAVARLRGVIDGPDGVLITPEILQLVQVLLDRLPQPSATAYAILLHLKAIFSSSPHPDISVESGRKLLRPIGGEAGRGDLFDDQTWKEEWGTWNSLRWCVEVMSTQDLIDNIPLILPPLLILLDDYKSSYRIRGLQILPAFLRIPPPVLQRTGIAQLLVGSIQHSISLHPSAPEPPLLERSLAQLFLLLHILYPAGQGKDAEAAKQVEQAVERGIVNGWAYAKSGQEGVEALVGVARAVEMVCQEVELGVIRWMRTFIPSLLSPLMFPPVQYIVPLQHANLQALHMLLFTISKTGRAGRWHGEIIDGVGRLIVALHERGVTAGEGQGRLPMNGTGKDDEASVNGNKAEESAKTDSVTGNRQDQLRNLSNLCKQIFEDLIQVAPTMKESEIPALLELDPNAFGFLSTFMPEGHKAS